MSLREIIAAMRAEGKRVNMLERLEELNPHLSLPAWRFLHAERRKAHMKRGRIKRLLNPNVVPMRCQEFWLSAAREPWRPAPHPPLPCAAELRELVASQQPREPACIVPMPHAREPLTA